MNKNQTRKEKEMTINELAKEMRSGFNAVQERFTSIDERFTSIDEKLESVDKEFKTVRQGIEVLNAKIDTVEENISEKLKFELGKFEERSFSPDEKESLLSTMKLINDHLAEDLLGREHITFTRKEYDATSLVSKFPNRFAQVSGMEVE